MRCSPIRRTPTSADHPEIPLDPDGFEQYIGWRLEQGLGVPPLPGAATTPAGEGGGRSSATTGAPATGADPRRHVQAAADHHPRIDSLPTDGKGNVKYGGEWMPGRGRGASGEGSRLDQGTRAGPALVDTFKDLQTRLAGELDDATRATLEAQLRRRRSRSTRTPSKSILKAEGRSPTAAAYDAALRAASTASTATSSTSSTRWGSAGAGGSSPSIKRGPADPRATSSTSATRAAGAPRVWTETSGSTRAACVRSPTGWLGWSRARPGDRGGRAVAGRAGAGRMTIDLKQAARPCARSWRRPRARPRRPGSRASWTTCRPTSTRRTVVTLAPSSGTTSASMVYEGSTGPSPAGRRAGIPGGWSGRTGGVPRSRGPGQRPGEDALRPPMGRANRQCHPLQGRAPSAPRRHRHDRAGDR